MCVCWTLPPGSLPRPPALLYFTNISAEALEPCIVLACGRPIGDWATHRRRCNRSTRALDLRIPGLLTQCYLAPELRQRSTLAEVLERPRLFLRRAALCQANRPSPDGISRPSGTNPLVQIFRR
jgi:hypothetical protein